VRRALQAAAIAVLAAGCGATSPGPDQGASVTLAGTLHYPPASPPAQTSGQWLIEAALRAAPKPKLLCDAPALAYLVGRPRTQIPVAADLSKRRVTCTSCPASEDHRPDRTDILFNAKTGLITDVTCG
jgi:hypothetical protein